jgi:O-antigen/teichoic acid export membrane protein
LSKKLIYNSISGTTLYFVSIIILFILSPVIVRSLGNRDYGIWEIVMSLVGYMGILDLGVGPALLRYVAVAESQKKSKELQEVISSAQFFYFLVGTMAVLVLLLVSQFPQLIFGRESLNVGYLGKVLILFTINIGLYFPLISLTAILMGLQYHFLINITRIIFGIIRALIVYNLLINNPGKGLLTLAIMEPIFNLIQFIMFAFVLHRNKEIPSFSIAACSLAKMRDLFTYGAKSAILMVASRVQTASLPFVISNMLGVSKIVYFAMPNRLVGYAKDLSMAIGDPLTPYFASNIGKGDKDTLRDSWLQTSLALQIITTAMPLFLFFCGERFLSVWIGREYGIAGRGVLYCLVAGLTVEAIAPNVSRILMATGNHGRAAVAWLVLSCICIPLTILGAAVWGITGVALGSSIIVIIGNFTTLRMACKEVDVSLMLYLRRTIMRLILPLLILLTVLWATTLFLSPHNYLYLILQVVVSGLFYLLAVWRFTLTNHIRGLMIDRLRMYLNKLIPSVQNY